MSVAAASLTSIDRRPHIKVATRTAKAVARKTPGTAHDHPNHLEDLSDAALVEGHDGVTTPDEFGGNIRLKIRKRENQVRMQGLDFVVARVDESRDFRFCTSLWRSHRVSGDPDNASALAE